MGDRVTIGAPRRGPDLAEKETAVHDGDPPAIVGAKLPRERRVDRTFSISASSASAKQTPGQQEKRRDARTVGHGGPPYAKWTPKDV
jgi:hypothetical protein